MKKHWLKILLCAAFLSFGAVSASAQIVVVRPRHDVVEVRPRCPGPKYIWRDGEWEWRAGAYVWVPGVWVIPERGRHWRRGHWRHSRRGYIWIGGVWR